MVRQSIDEHVALLEGGAALARQTRRLLEAAGLLASQESASTAPTRFYTTGQVNDLRDAAARWLQLDTEVNALAV